MKLKTLHLLFAAFVAVSFIGCNDSGVGHDHEHGEHYHGDGHDHEGEDLKHSKGDGHKHD